jgi:hypothetical protein
MQQIFYRHLLRHIHFYFYKKMRFSGAFGMSGIKSFFSCTHKIFFGIPSGVLTTIIIAESTKTLKINPAKHAMRPHKSEHAYQRVLFQSTTRLTSCTSM